MGEPKTFNMRGTLSRRTMARIIAGAAKIGWPEPVLARLRETFRGEIARQVRSASSFSGGDDRLSRAATVVREHQDRQGAIADDLEAFGAPGECYRDAYADEDDRLERVLAPLGFTTETFTRALRERVSARHAYLLSPCHVPGAGPVYPDDEEDDGSAGPAYLDDADGPAPESD